MAKHENKIQQSFADENANVLHTKKKRGSKNLLIIAGIVLLVVAVAVVAYFVVFKPGGQQAEEPYDPYQERLAALEQGSVPTDPLDQAIYYSQLAQNLTGLQRFDSALDNYFKAQEIIDKNNLRGQIMFYLPIIEVYIAKKDNNKAKEYAEKAIQFYSEEYIKLRPEDKSTAEDTVKALQKQKDTL